MTRTETGARLAIRLAAVIAGAFAGAGCGDPLVSHATYETPLLSFQPYMPELFQAASLDGMSIGIVWVDPLQQRDDRPQPPAGMAVRRNDRDFTVDLFAPPPAAAIRRLPDPRTRDNDIAVSFAFGEIVVYADRDGDGKFALAPRAEGSTMVPPDEYVGSAAANAVIYVETPATAARPAGAGGLTVFDP